MSFSLAVSFYLLISVIVKQFKDNLVTVTQLALIPALLRHADEEQLLKNVDPAFDYRFRW